MRALQRTSDVEQYDDEPRSNSSDNHATRDQNLAQSDHNRLNQLNESFSQIASRINTLSANIADSSGTVGDVTLSLEDHVASLHQLLSSMEALEQRNQTIGTVTNDAIERAMKVHEELSHTSSAMEEIFTTSSDDIQRISASTSQTIDEFTDIKSELAQVHDHSQSIQKISTQTRMLAINAGVMAAHAGSAGKGFGVVAESISELSDQTAAVSSNIIQRLDALETTIGRLLGHSQQSHDITTIALGRREQIDSEFEKFREFGSDVEALIALISNLAQPLADNNQACELVGSDLRALSASSHDSLHQLQATAGQFDDLVSFTESMFLLLEQSGIETIDTPIIRRNMALADEISTLFSDAVQTGRLTIDDLFDDTYVPIEGTNPQQVMTRFTKFTDDALADLQEAQLAFDDRIAFCAAIDRNGYIPTHNKAVSKPQGADPVWNAANCRNRRIFDDRTGLAAGRNQAPFLMQTYRRDMGGGTFIVMKDLSAPIIVQGRHWGGLRMGIKLS